MCAVCGVRCTVYDMIVCGVWCCILIQILTLLLPHRYVVPRFTRAAPSDLDTSRIHHGLPRVLCGTGLLRRKGDLEDLLYRGSHDDGARSESAPDVESAGASPRPAESRAAAAICRDLNRTHGLHAFQRYVTRTVVGAVRQRVLGVQGVPGVGPTMAVWRWWCRCTRV